MKEQAPSFKGVGWAYPSSPNACKFKLGKSGCYDVYTVLLDAAGNRQPPVAVAGYAEFDEALAHAERIEAPWDFFTIGGEWEGVLKVPVEHEHPAI